MQAKRSCLTQSLLLPADHLVLACILQSFLSGVCRFLSLSILNSHQISCQFGSALSISVLGTLVLLAAFWEGKNVCSFKKLTKSSILYLLLGHLWANVSLQSDPQAFSTLFDDRTNMSLVVPVTT